MTSKSKRDHMRTNGSKGRGHNTGYGEGQKIYILYFYIDRIYFLTFTIERERQADRHTDRYR